jgi:hypothetical protein
MRVMEKHYLLPTDVLHQVRINRTRKQRDTRDTDGVYSPSKGLDEIMERLMPHMKKFSHCGSFQSWIKISKELMFCLKAKSFVSFCTKMRQDAEYEMNERAYESFVGDDKEGTPSDPLCDPLGNQW